MTTTPDLTRPGVELVLCGEHPRGRHDESPVTEDWPDRLLAYTVLPSTDGRTELHYAQWATDSLGRRAAHPDVPYRMYRRYVGDSAPGAPGVIVAKIVETDDVEHARRLADAQLDATRAERPPGLLSSNYHVATDGSRLLNYAEWLTETALDAFFDSRTGPPPAAVRELMRDRLPSVRSFHPGRTLTAA